MRRESRIRRRRTTAGGGESGTSAYTVGPWRYVGDIDEPAFEDTWTSPSGVQRLAFRYAGPVDDPMYVEISGVAFGGTPGTTIFFLPAELTPDVTAPFFVAASADGFVTSYISTITIRASDGRVRENGGSADGINIRGQIPLVQPEIQP